MLGVGFGGALRVGFGVGGRVAFGVGVGAAGVGRPRWSGPGVSLAPLPVPPHRLGRLPATTPTGLRIERARTSADQHDHHQGDQPGSDPNTLHVASPRQSSLY